METQLFAKESACAAIVETGHALIEKKLVAGSWGNISCRIDAQNIAITPSGHGYETLTPEDVVIINRDGEVVEGKRIPSSELKVHTAIYNAYPEAGAVIHTHSIYASALAAMHQGVPAIIEDIVQIIGGGGGGVRPIRSLRYTGAGGEHRACAERQKGCAAGQPWRCVLGQESGRGTACCRNSGKGGADCRNLCRHRQ